jgi:hypothetical protein
MMTPKLYIISLKSTTASYNLLTGYINDAVNIVVLILPGRVEGKENRDFGDKFRCGSIFSIYRVDTPCGEICEQVTIYMVTIRSTCVCVGIEGELLSGDSWLASMLSVVIGPSLLHTAVDTGGADLTCWRPSRCSQR